MKSLGTALRVLAQFTGTQPSWGVSELAERCGLPKGQVSKILSTFREHGFLVKDSATRRYSVGLRVFALGSRFVNHHALTRDALPIMRALANKSGHSVRLSVVDRSEVIYLLAIEGPLLLDTGWRAGTVLPWHATSAGRVLLAFSSEAEQNVILERTGLPAITPYTVTDRSKLDAILRRIRLQGYGTARGESTLGLGAISVPVLGTGQKIIGTLSLAFPEHVVPEADEPKFVEMLHDSARMLSMRSGSPVYSFRVGEPPRPALASEPTRAAAARSGRRPR
jgi:DNA-binding IclR family transcriptional regulator